MSISHLYTGTAQRETAGQRAGLWMRRGSHAAVSSVSVFHAVIKSGERRDSAQTQETTTTGASALSPRLTTAVNRH